MKFFTALLAGLVIALLSENILTRIKLDRTAASLKATTASLNSLNSSSNELQTNCQHLLKSANRVGFTGALFGYAAAQKGMKPEEFVLMAIDLFSKTNVPIITIEIGTNAIDDLQELKGRHRL
jgi:hypothetical protein